MQTIKNAVVVTRHAGLVDYLKSQSIIDDTATIIEHATPENVANKHVIGVLPHSLSCLTDSFTEVPLHIPAELRGAELTAEQMALYAKPPVTYKVSKING